MPRTGIRWSSIDGLVAFAGGAAAALLASRVLPPLLAQAAGQARGVGDKDPFRALEKDHRTILSLASEMAQSSDRSAARRTQLLLRLKHQLSAHALAEEDVVYPLLHDEAREVGDAKHLYNEHADMKIHLYALEQMPKNDPRWAQRAGELLALLADHIRQEEHVDFPKLRAALDGATKRRMNGHIQREKALLL